MHTLTGDRWTVGGEAGGEVFAGPGGGRGGGFRVLGSMVGAVSMADSYRRWR